MNANEATLVLADEYNRMAEAYDRSVAPRLEAVAKLVVEALAPKPNEMVLDVGTGTGILACLLGPLVVPAQAVAIDLADEVIRVASYRAGNAGVRNVRFEMMDARNIVYRSQLFDAVGSNLGIPNYGYERTFYEVHRLLKPDGRFVFSEWDKDPGPVAALFYRLEERFGTPTPSKALAQVREARTRHAGVTEAEELRDPAAVKRKLEARGFARVEDRAKVLAVRFAAPADYVGFMTGFGWHERELAEMPPDRRAAFDAEFAKGLADRTTPVGFDETWHVHVYVARP